MRQFPNNQSYHGVTGRFLLVTLLFLFLAGPALADDKEEARLWKKGNTLMLNADWKAVIKTFSELLTKFPGTRHVEARFWIGYSYLQLGKYATGIRALEEFTGKYPGNPYASQALFKKAEALEKGLKQYDRALAAYNQIVSQYPDSLASVPAAQNQAIIYQTRKKDYSRAQMEFAKSKKIAEEQGQSSESVYINRANDRIRFIRENSDYNYVPLSIFTDAQNLEEDKKYDRAVKVYRSLVQKYPGANIADDAMYKEIVLLLKLRNFSEAESMAEKFLKDYNKSPLVPRVKTLLEQARKAGENLRNMMKIYFV